jgi:hypothetical protein
MFTKRKSTNQALLPPLAENQSPTAFQKYDQMTSGTSTATNNRRLAGIKS